MTEPDTGDALAVAHIEAGRLGRPDLTVAEEAHLTRCVRCRAERRVLMSSPGSARPTPDVLDDRSWLGQAAGPIPPEAPLEGATVGDGRYRDLHEIGRGAFGLVYRAFDTVYGVSVALKSLPRVQVQRQAQLKAEFRRSAELSHPNLAMMYDLVVDAEDAFFTMELIDGRPPSVRPQMAPGALHALAVQLFDGLAALHEAGLVHRDVKPANILVEPGGRAVLVDFGLLAMIGESGDKVAGTVGYMAPEALQAASPTAAVDVYALGLVLFELARGDAWTIAGQVPGRLDLREGLANQAPALEDVVTDCLRSDPLHRPTSRQAWLRLTRGRPVVRPVALARDAGFVGREDALAWLRKRRRALVRVEGPAGVGKTALLEAALRDRVVVAGRCHAWETVPFNAFDGPLERLSIPKGRDTFPSEVASRLVEAFPADAVLWLDDAQWMDEDSRAVLRALVATEDAPKVILSHRPVEPGHPLLEEGWFTVASVLPVGPLSQMEAVLLAERLVDDDAAGLARLSGGHPLLLRSLARRWAEGKRDQADLPALVRQELASHGALAAAVLLRVALHTGPLPLRVLARSVEDEGLPRALAGLLKARILAYATTDAVAFVHDVVREVQVAELSPGDRVALHERLAAAFEVVAPDDAGAVALHLAAAGAGPRVREPAERAARAAEAVCAWARAADFYRLALEASDPRPPELVRRLGECLAASGHTARAGRLLRDQGGPGDLARAAELLVSGGAFEEGEAVLAAALAAHRMVQPSSRLGGLARGGGWALWWRLRDPVLAPAVDPAQGRVADTLWSVTGALGQFDSVRTFAFEGQHLGASFASGDPARAARALALHLVYFESSVGGGARVARLDRALDALVTAAGTDEVAAWVEVSRGYREFLVGSLPRALTRFEAAEQRYGRTDAYRWERTLGVNHRVFAFGHLGRHEAMARGYHSLRGRYAELGDRASEALLELGGGYLVALAADRPDEAEARLDHAASLLPRPMPLAFAFLEMHGRIQVDRYRGDHPRALRRLTDAWGALSDLRWFRMPAILQRHARTMIEAQCGRIGPRQVQREAARLRADPSPFAQAHGAALDVVAARLRGDVGAERAALDRLDDPRHGFFDLVAAARLRRARLDGDAAAAEAVRIGGLERGLVRPEAFLGLFVAP